MKCPTPSSENVFNTIWEVMLTRLSKPIRTIFFVPYSTLANDVPKNWTPQNDPIGLIKLIVSVQQPDISTEGINGSVRP